jgi:hypothetical protein
MASPRQIEANRRNARRSSGLHREPVAAARRDVTLSHGLRAIQTVILGEAPTRREAQRATASYGDLADETARVWKPRHDP